MGSGNLITYLFVVIKLSEAVLQCQAYQDLFFLFFLLEKKPIANLEFGKKKIR